MNVRICRERVILEFVCKPVIIEIRIADPEKDFLMELKANGLSNNTLDNYRKAVDTLSFLEERPENLTKQDLIEWSVHLQEECSEGSQSLYKACVRRYIKWLKTGDLNGGEYPECVEWMKVSDNFTGTTIS